MTNRRPAMRKSGVGWRFVRKVAFAGVLLIGAVVLWRSYHTSDVTLDTKFPDNKGAYPKSKNSDSKSTSINTQLDHPEKDHQNNVPYFKPLVKEDTILVNEGSDLQVIMEKLGPLNQPDASFKRFKQSDKNQPNVRGQPEKVKNEVSKDVSANGQETPKGCQKVTPFRQPYQAEISTYDLPEMTNFTLNSKGKYNIPVKPPASAHRPDVEQVKVFVVPFSHADPGYGRTMEDYYQGSTVRTLENMVDRLGHYPNMTFQWVETVFLERWWKDISEMNKQKVKNLLARGQLEIVLGGWVMPDEASTHYSSVVDQLIEGHQWLLEHLGVKVKDAWVNDPFGYSSTMPYLWKSSGIENMVFLRIHQAIKSTLMRRGSLEFNWKPYWSRDSKNDLLCSLMSYEGYWVGDVCGPDYDVCSQFAFMHPHAVQVTEQNIEKQATKLYEQYRITADLYKYKTLYIGIGEDFSFSNGRDWDEIYTNFDKLMRYINNRPEWKMSVKFGTLSEYFASVRKEEKQKSAFDEKEGFPTLSGDFFPYSDKEDAYWTGYFTTRPLNKRISREIEPVLRIADVYNVLAFYYHQVYGMQYTAYNDVNSFLRDARRELGMFLHHDGITGTSLPHVVSDFETRLKKAEQLAHDAMKKILATVLSRGSNPDAIDLQEEIQRPAARTVSRSVVLQPATPTADLVIVNPLERPRRQFVHVVLSSKDVYFTDHAGKAVDFQLTESTSEQTRTTNFVATFQTELPPFAIQMVKVRFGTASSTKVPIRPRRNIDPTIVLKNAYITAEFDGRTGLLRRVTDMNGRVTNINVTFMVYRTSKSGAYLFGPDGPATSIVPDSVDVSVAKGLLSSSVTVRWLGVYHKVTIYNSTSIQGQGIHIRNEVDIGKMKLSNSEVVIRFQTGMKNGDNFFTDQNGFTFIGRKNYPKRPIETNFYPMTTMTILEDSRKRMTLHSGQPLGVAALAEGQLEVMLDRTMLTDDGRGLGQGVSDRLNVDSEFIVQVEYKTNSFPLQEPRYTEPSLAALSMNEQLQKPIIKYISRKTPSGLLAKVHPMKTSVPCDLSIVGLRNLVADNLAYTGTSLVLHRKPNTCGYPSVGLLCETSSEAFAMKSVFSKRSVSIEETSLSHVHPKKTITMSDDLRPEMNELRSFKIKL